jgi:hypothetical protein
MISFPKERENIRRKGVIVLTIGEDNLFDNKEGKNIMMDHLGEDNQNSQEGIGQEPEFNMYGTALNEL